ncbi:MAG: alpha-ketoglutarate-dependent dioxygenase AlkB [Rhodobacteraceae bacterium]|nr:alpha-ketoglutarate-dependent dioxygenase AlkB [Paracoccaceae bacterium]
MQPFSTDPGRTGRTPGGEGPQAGTTPGADGSARELRLGGLRILPGRIAPPAQAALLEDIREVVRQAPLFTPETARGRRMSVKMTAAGRFGWISDRRGYRYEPRHPAGTDWPPIPLALTDLWHAVVPSAKDPECCLVNFYGEAARMGLHQDRDEADLTQPVLSVSLGDAALFRIGGAERGGRTQSVWLNSGDVVVLEGDGRLAYHGIDRIRFGSSALLEGGGRINLTLRVVR